MEFKQPPVLYNEKGELRKVGFEIEFGELNLDAVANCIIETYGGTKHRISNFLQEVTDTAIGKFTLKMDSRILTEKQYEGTMEKFGIDGKTKDMEDLVESVASWVVPYEIDTPPVPITEVAIIDKLRHALFQKNAKGTKYSILYAYATHVNAEIPAQNAETILRYLKAFLLLYPWIFETSDISLSRKIASYISPFKDNYIKLVLQPGYNPDLETLIDDYHKYNPDRNRPLDLYPVFAWLDKEKIGAMEGIGNVKPRPTLHYRLPNSLVDEKDWSIANEWNSWVVIEKLATNPQKIKLLCKEYLELEEDTLFGFNDKWIRRTEDWVEL